jgi:mxaA protein
MRLLSIHAAARIAAVLLPAWPGLAPTLAEGFPAPIRSVSVAPQRDYGLVVGETLASEIRVAVEPGFELEAAALPLPGVAVSDFLELREIGWAKQPQGGETLYRIRLVYQVFKGVRDAETVAVPALPLRFNRAGQAAEADAPGWNFTLTPIIPPGTADDTVALRGDLPPPSLPDRGPGRWLLACLAGLAGLGVYAGERAGLLRRRAPPFVRAARALKTLGRQPSSLDTWRQGARLVHAALNETAGHTVLSGQLRRFLAARPDYAGLQAELEQFFRHSDRLFFAEAADWPADYPLARLEALCRRLAAAGGGR